MKKTLVLLVVFLAIAAPVGAALSLHDHGEAAVGGDRNAGVAASVVGQADAQMEAIHAQIVSRHHLPHHLCAIAVMPGPAGSFDIRLGVFNTTLARTLDYLIEDSFFALGGQSLLHESVFATVPPPGGSLTVEYPASGGGKGPVVLSFADFGPLESASYNTDPDTYDDPNFGATVQDMEQTRLEGVFSHGLRCAGTLEFNAGLNAAVALLTQTSP